MKKTILLSATLAIYAMMQGNVTNAQGSLGLLRVDAENTSQNFKTGDTFLRTANTDKRYINNINIAAIRDLNNRFKNVANATWRRTDFGGYVAEFRFDSIQILLLTTTRVNVCTP